MVRYANWLTGVPAAALVVSVWFCSNNALWPALAAEMPAAQTGLGTSAPVPGFPTRPELLLFGGDGHRVFLGCLNCSKYDNASVFNEFGRHGSRHGSESIFNRFGDYGSKYSSHSACNPYATDPPVVVDRSGNYYGRLTVKRIDQVRNAAIAAWITGVCAGG